MVQAVTPWDAIHPQAGAAGFRKEINCRTVPFTRSSSATADAFHSETNPLCPSWVITAVYGSVPGMCLYVERLKRWTIFPSALFSRTALVRTIACHQDALFAAAQSTLSRRRIGHILELLAPHFSQRQLFTRSQRQAGISPELRLHSQNHKPRFHFPCFPSLFPVDLSTTPSKQTNACHSR